MKRKGWVTFCILLGLVLSVFSGCQTQPGTGTYTDDIGRSISIDEAPQSIVSYGPSITEIFFALGLEEKVVGVSSYSDYPEAAQDKPDVGDAWNPSLERIVELAPDLVFTVEHSELNNQLENLGLTFVVLDPKDIDDIFDDIELVGEITGVEAAAEALIEDMQSSMSQVETQVADAPAVSVFYIVDATDPNQPWTAGAGSFIDALITLAGGKNIASGTEGDWVQFSLEQVVSADPEVIIIQTMTGGMPTISADELAAHPGWGEMTAVKQGNTCFIDGDLVSRPGPRIVQGLEEIARGIHPALFE